MCLFLVGIIHSKDEKFFVSVFNANNFKFIRQIKFCGDQIVESPTKKSLAPVPRLMTTSFSIDSYDGRSQDNSPYYEIANLFKEVVPNVHCSGHGRNVFSCIYIP